MKGSPMHALNPQVALAALRLAHDSIAAALEERDFTPQAVEGLEPAVGHFVSLHKAGHLRGCIGVIETREPLWRCLPRTARSAAFEDPRFPALKPHEWPQCQVELSILTPPVAVEGPEQIHLGRHGIILEMRQRRALFLPQVAPEQGWTLEETLAHLAAKAGLAPDAWRDGDCTFQIFEAQIIHEKSIGL